MLGNITMLTPTYHLFLVLLSEKQVTDISETCSAQKKQQVTCPAET